MSSLKNNLRWVERFSYVNLAIGLAEIIAGVILFLINSEFQDYGQFYDDCEECFTLLILIGIFFVLLGALGIYAQRVKSNNSMSIYNIGIILLMLFIGGSIIVIILLQVQLSQFKDDIYCTEEDLMIELSTAYNAGKKLLCSSKCSCNADQSNFPPQIYQSFSVSKKGANKLNECQDYIKRIDTQFPFGYENKQLENFVSLLKTSEEKFNCSGFCSTNSYYVFRDMNDGTPVDGQDCKVEFLNYISKSVLTTTILISIVTIYIIIISYFSLRIIFSQEKTNNEGYYKNSDQIQLPQINKLNNDKTISQNQEKNQNNLK
ncbi:tetraspanin family protein (macronuclear) [Tetrahymena thermophila SB210]|uniref:Tetraspanin family protein n=1 Tax=Tetrahymena thermophila (strain SB210) TaxID=312017 RepID=Q22RT7_TETTS|nr:tetraspanin family protein [Tetrahymena thermophila SB210]EAR88035.1 tetraspanin family protein [Tetrahymena thermophila SB210]|eukprot:XP_001008280.1 tetraspanin family protein [Tetrahymena thermophila SB210]